MSTITHYVGRRELLRELGISKSTLIRWTAERAFPLSLPNSGQVPIYDRNDIDRWLRSERFAEEQP
jgi:predicted DNA-binding transcriptional regulator AlpA